MVLPLSRARHSLQDDDRDLSGDGDHDSGAGLPRTPSQEQDSIDTRKTKNLETFLRSLLVSLQYTVLILLGFMMEAFIGLLSYIYQVHDVSTKRIFNLALLGWWMKDTFFLTSWAS